MKKSGLFNTMKNRSRITTGLGIAALYVLIGSLWILFSDQVVAQISPTEEAHLRLSMIKGWAYVLATGVVLYLLINRSYRSLMRVSQRYQLLAENTTDVIWMMDPISGRFTYVSPSVEKLRGYTPEEVMARPVSESLTPESWKMVKEGLEQKLPAFLAKGTGSLSATNEVDQPCKDGSIVHTEATTTYMFTPQGTVEIVGVTRNISERRRAEQEKRNALELFQKVFALSPFGVALTRLSDRLIIDANPAMEKLVGYKREELVGHRSTEFDYWLYPSERQRGFEIMQRQGAVRDFEFTYKTKQGKTGQAVTSTEAFEQNGETYFLSTFMDITARKQAEAALHDSEERFHRVMDDMLEGCQIIGFDWRYVYVNKMVAAQGHNTREALLGRTMMEMYPGIENTGLFAIMNDCMENRTPHHFDNPFTFPNGEMGWFELSIQPAPEGIFILSIDISERKRAEVALHKNQMFLHSIIDNSTSLIYALDLEGRFTLANTALQKVLGKTGEELLGKTRQDLLPPEIAGEHRRNDLEVIGSEKPIFFEERNEEADGTHFYLTVKSLLLDMNGQPYAVSGISSDITERKRAEEALRQSEEKYKLLFESNPSPMWVYDTNTLRFLMVNDAAINHYGYSREEFLEMTIKDIRPQEEIPNLLENLSRESAALQRSGGWKHRLKNGTLIDVEINSHAILFNGSPARLVLASDITERKLAEKALQKNEALLSEAQRIGRIGHLEWTLPDHHLTCSEEIYRMLELPPDQPISQHTLAAMMTPEEDARLRNLDQKIFASHSNLDYEFRLTLPSGGQRWMHQFAEMTYTADGQPVRMMGILQDITDRKQVEQALIESERRSRLAQEGAHIGIWEMDLLNGETYWSPEYEILYGTGPGGIHSEADWRARVHPEDLPLIDAEWERHIQHRQPFEVEFRIRHQSGETRWMLNKGNAQFDESGQPVRLIGVNLDITSRKQAEDEIRQRNEDLSLINTLNHAANRSEDIEAITEIFTREVRKVFKYQDAALYLLSPDKKHLEMLSNTVAESITERIEKLLGLAIPKISIPIHATSRIHEFLSNPEGTILDDSGSIQQWMGEFVETPYLPNLIRPTARKLIPQVLKMLKIQSMLNIPLISSGQAIGLIELSSQGQITQEELKRLRTICQQITAIILRKQAELKVQTQINRITALSRIDRAISASLDMRMSLDVLLNEVLLQLKADAASILLLNDNQVFEFAAGKGFRTHAIRRTRIHFGDGLTGKAGLERKPVHVYLNEADSNYIRADLLKGEDFVEYFGVPLVAKSKLKGMLEVFHRSSIHPDVDWTNYLETLGGQAAIAIDNAQLFERLQQSNQELITAYDATILGWSLAMDLRDKETEGHTQRVTDLAVRLGERMGVGQQEIGHMRRGALLHDIGKLGVPDHILLKPGKLTQEEWEIMRQHPNYALNMLLPIPYLRPALDIPYCHHEKWDGSGYPRGLKGDQIPFAARLFAIVDVWDALRTDRPYREKWSVEQTRAHLLEQSGKHFEPRIVTAFIRLLDEHPELQ